MSSFFQKLYYRVGIDISIEEFNLVCCNRFSFAFFFFLELTVSKSHQVKLIFRNTFGALPRLKKIFEFLLMMIFDKTMKMADEL